MLPNMYFHNLLFIFLLCHRFIRCYIILISLYLVCFPTLNPKVLAPLIIYYYCFPLGFLVEHRASVAHLHCALFSAVFKTWFHNCPQALIFSSHYFLHVTFTSNPNSSFPIWVLLNCLAPDVPSWSSHCISNPSPLPSANLLSDRFLLGSLPVTMSSLLFFLSGHLSFSIEP
ncbi:unnamed protein product, partial [Heterobilharzia americana]